MELETINKLYLELSQVATAKTHREIMLFAHLKISNELLRSAHSIATRKGAETNWDSFLGRVSDELNAQHRIIRPTPETPWHHNK